MYIACTPYLLKKSTLCSDFLALVYRGIDFREFNGLLGRPRQKKKEPGLRDLGDTYKLTLGQHQVSSEEAKRPNVEAKEN